MIQNFPPCYAMGMTSFTVGFTTTGTAYTIVAPVKGQIGVALWSGSTGIEVGGAGISYGPTSITLINGVTTTLTFMNSNGSSLLLVSNGNGLPIYNTVLAPISFAGAPQLWLSAGSTALSCRVTYFFNDAFQNQ